MTSINPLVLKSFKAQQQANVKGREGARLPHASNAFLSCTLFKTFRSLSILVVLSV